MVLLKTVRAKLTTLVGLSAIATLAALPLLHWLMTRELVDVVDDRVPEATRGFELELADDIKDLEAATRSLGDSDDLQKAVQASTPAAAEDELRVFRDAYPGTGWIVYGRGATPLAQVGLPGPAFARTALGESTGELRFVAENGCGADRTGDPAFVLARSIRGDGLVVACMSLGPAYLENTSEKLGLELALASMSCAGCESTPDEKGNLVSSQKLQIGAHTHRFPLAAMGKSDSDGLTEVDGRAWATTTFLPAPFVGVRGAGRVVAALDMTRIQGVVRRNLAMTVAVLVLAALTAIAMGSRLASLMSRALGQLNRAYKNVENDNYEHVSGVKTGDEIETLASGFNAMVDGLRERDKLRMTMGKYMTQSVVEHLMSGKLELGGEPLTVTILFSDIRSFTSISERMTAQELVKLLNEYFTEMVTVVMEEGGVVDKYIGDAIMAVFGAPVARPDDAYRAVRAAVRMRHALAVLNEKLVARGTPPIRTGVGIHTGEVVAGNIGSEARMEYTVIGDAVNLASRLESNTKELGTDVLISQDTLALLGDAFVTRAVREITVKGRAKPVMVHEVTGFRDEKEAPPLAGVEPASSS